MNLQETIHELFAENGETLFSELSLTDKYRFTEAFILEDDSDMGEVLLTLPEKYHALIFSQIAGPSDDLDLYIFRVMVRNAQVAYYAEQIQTEMDCLWPSWESEREECRREASYDELNDTLRRIASIPMAQKQAD